MARWRGGQVVGGREVWWPGVSRQLDCQGGEEWRGLGVAASLAPLSFRSN